MENTSQIKNTGSFRKPERSQRSETSTTRQTLSLAKPECKDGVCTISWKPVKPAA